MRYFTRRRLRDLTYVCCFVALNWFVLNKLFGQKKYPSNVEYFNLKSECKCRKDIYIKKHSEVDNLYEVDRNLILFDRDGSKKKALDEYLNRVQVEYDEIFINPRFTCDLYNTFRHGPHKKVIGFSFYGTNTGYFTLIDLIAQQAKKLFPDWIIRVYFEKTVSESFMCEIECKHETVHFCNAHKVPYQYDDKIDVLEGYFRNDESKKQFFDLTYVHAMMWRWFPITDSFVDYFSSRDSDSTLIQREKDAVDVWLQRNTLFHVIRDNPYHNTVILGGLWSFANVRNRALGQEIFQKFISKDVQIGFNPQSANMKGYDQTYLAQHVWPIANQNATIHDSYNCLSMGGEPFPTQRPTNMYCFVSCFNPCCDEIHNQTQRMPTCPVECRPKDHQDWTTC